MPSIDILCAVGTNGAPYAEYLKKTAEILSTSNADFNWKCILGLDRNRQDRVPEGFHNVGKSSNKIDQASVNHTNSMHELLEHASADYTIIADVDVALLKQGWDQILLDELKNVDCFGIGWGSWDRKYLDFPCIMFIGFKTELLHKVKWDLRPETKGKAGSCLRYEAGPKDARICNVPVGTQLKKDSGWKIPYFIPTGRAAEKVKVGSKKSMLPFESAKQKSFCIKKPTHMSEYIYNGELYATHLQACRSKPWNDRHALTWRKRIHHYLLDKYGISLEPEIV